MNKLTPEKRKQILMIGAGTLVALVLLYMVVITNQQMGLLEEDGRIKEAASKLEDAELWIKKAKIILPEYEAVKVEILKEEVGMAPSFRNDWKVWMCTALYFVQTNRHHDVMLGEITLDPGEMYAELLPKFPYSATRFRVPIIGYYNDLGKYLADVENQFPYLRVENLMMIPQAAAGPNAGGPNTGAPSSANDAARQEKLFLSTHMVVLLKGSAGQ